MNNPTSARMVKPIGTPSRKTSTKAGHSGRQKRWNSRYSECRGCSAAHPAMIRKITLELKTEATAAPRTPISGQPKLPKISP